MDIWTDLMVYPNFSYDINEFRASRLLDLAEKSILK